MGKGDPRTAKGKRFKGSFGNSRLQKAVKKVVVAAAAEVKPAKKKAVKKKSEE